MGREDSGSPDGEDLGKEMLGVRAGEEKPPATRLGD
jgi:hypothetical protein